MAKTINIILADPNPLVLSAMSEIFERDSRFSLVATSSTAEGFLGMVMRVPVDIGIIDWDLPALGGAKLIDVLRDQDTAPRIIVYGSGTNNLPQIAMAAGAAAFASRSDNIDALLATCMDVYAGKMVFPFLDIRDLQNDPIQKLSRKERIILEAMSKGLTNRDLALELSISINTVKFHLSNIFEKLAVRNRSQAIAYFYSNKHPNDKKGFSFRLSDY